MDLDAVAEGLANAAKTISGLTCYPYTPDSVAEPAFYIGDIEIDYDQAYGRGMDQAVVTCIVLASRADDLTGQKKLRGYVKGSGATSLKVALEAARGAPGQLALSGACDDFRVERAYGMGLYTLGDNTYYGAKLAVRVIGSGS
jgi:hypothetical protein